MTQQQSKADRSKRTKRRKSRGRRQDHTAEKGKDVAENEGSKSDDPTAIYFGSLDGKRRRPTEVMTLSTNNLMSGQTSSCSEIAVALRVMKRQKFREREEDDDDAPTPLSRTDVATPRDPYGPCFPFPTEADDHCETPLVAYQHIAPFLDHVACNGKANFRIYDPYYCDGAATRNLANVGFSNVYHQREDCYAVWCQSGSTPAFNCLVTNPPYSGNHIERLLDFVTSPTLGTLPWFLLLPNWVHKKDYFVRATGSLSPFYIVPRSRYVYVPPKNFRERKKSDVHKKSSPFVSMWYIWGGTVEQNDILMELGMKLSRSGDSAFDVARSKSALRDLRRKMR